MTKRADNPWQEHFFHGFGFPASSPVASTGLVTCVTNANMADSDYITVGDGINPAILFEYDKSANGVTSGRTAVTAGSSTAIDVAAAFVAAINTAMPALLAAAVGDGTFTIAHRWPGAGGNITITENVANAGFLVSGLTGGTNTGNVTATTVSKLLTAQRGMRFDVIELDIPVGFVQDASNYWIIALKKGSTVIAQWSTLTSAQGTIAADTFVNLINSTTDADLVAAVGDVLSLSLTKVASAANLTAGRIVVHGRFVS